MDDDQKEEYINAYFDTRRRISAIEKKALQKVGKETAGSFLEECSFCARSESKTVFLIHGDKKARICADCARQIVALLGQNENGQGKGFPE